MDLHEYSKEALLKLLVKKNTELEKKNTELDNKNAELDNKNAELDNNKDHISIQQSEIIRLKEIIKLLKDKLFGSSSEKKSTLPQDNLLDEAVPPSIEAISEIEAADEEISVKSHIRKIINKNGSRRPLPDYLPVVEEIYDLPESEKICNCGLPLKYIKDVVTEQLGLIPMQLYKKVIIRRKYAGCENKCDEIIKTSPMPIQSFPKSIASPSLIAHIVTAKYEDHLPLYRQESIFQRLEIDIARQTLSNWVLKAAELLNPLYKLLQENICSYDVAFADETTLQVLKEKDRKSQTKSYMWVAGGGKSDKFCYYYHYSPSRSHEVLYEIIPDFSGYLHSDGYSAYDCFANKQKEKSLNITQVGCWYHARRKFIEVAKVSKNKGIASWIIDRIGRLAKIEEESKTLLAEERYKIRQNKSIPVLNEMKIKLESSKDTIPPKSKLGEAVNYTLNQWNKLINYTLDGRLANNNNIMEREIKPFAVGRKNWLFSNSVQGAICSAIFFSFRATCKCHKINFYLWLKYVFRVIKETPNDKLSELLPYNIDPILLKAESEIPELKSSVNNLDNFDTS